MEIIKSEELKEKRLNKNEQSLRDLWDTLKWTNICSVVVPQGKEQEAERIFEEILAENPPNLMKYTWL